MDSWYIIVVRHLQPGKYETCKQQISLNKYLLVIYPCLASKSTLCIYLQYLLLSREIVFSCYYSFIDLLFICLFIWLFIYLFIYYIITYSFIYLFINVFGVNLSLQTIYQLYSVLQRRSACSKSKTLDRALCNGELFRDKGFSAYWARASSSQDIS